MYTQSQGTRVMPRQVVAEAVSPVKADLKSVAKSFYSTLQKLLMDFIDPDKDMQINGMTIEAKDKTGFAGTLVIGRAINDSTKALEYAFDFKTNQLSLEKKLTATAGA